MQYVPLLLALPALERATQARAASDLLQVADQIRLVNPISLRKFAPHYPRTSTVSAYSLIHRNHHLSPSNKPPQITGTMSGVLGGLYKYAPATRARPLARRLTSRKALSSAATVSSSAPSLSVPSLPTCTICEIASLGIQRTNRFHSAFNVGSNKIWDSINQGVRLAHHV
jgi:hypothetical protein